jgi:hypothetical protein
MGIVDHHWANSTHFHDNTYLWKHLEIWNELAIDISYYWKHDEMCDTIYPHPGNVWKSEITYPFTFPTVPNLIKCVIPCIQTFCAIKKAMYILKFFRHDNQFITSNTSLKMTALQLLYNYNHACTLISRLIKVLVSMDAGLLISHFIITKKVFVCPIYNNVTFCSCVDLTLLHCK